MTKQISVQDHSEQPVPENVETLMGPAQRLDGSKPTEEEMTALQNAGLIHDEYKVAGERKVPQLVTAEPPKISPKPVKPVPIPDPAPDTDITDINKQLEKQVEEGLEDLDIATLGESDVVQTEKLANELHNLTAPTKIPITIPDAEPIVMKLGLFDRLKTAILAWWDNPRKRYLTLGIAVLVIGAVSVVPSLRTLALNLVGMRSGVVAHVIDSSTTMPLKNAIVEVGSTQVKTDEDGNARLKGVKLGPQTVTIKKIAFATVTKKVSIGMRVADLGDVAMKPSGTQLTYLLTDFVSGKPIVGVELESGESTATSDKSGKAVITLQPSTESDIKITVGAKGYRSETLLAPADGTKPLPVRLVANQQHVYVSKQSGKYDVYKSYLDGKKNEVLLEATGLESPGMTTSVSPDGKAVAVTSTRDEQRNKDGYLLTALTLVDIASGEATVIEHAESIALLGWKNDAIVYQVTVAGASAANPNRQKIMLYDIPKERRLQLANANYFSASFFDTTALYYVLSATDPAAKESFSRIGYDGNNKKALYQGEVWSAIRTGYDTYQLQTPDKWLNYKVGANAPTPGTPPNSFASRQYLVAPSGTNSTWLDPRDAKTAFIRRDAGGKETIATSLPSVQFGIRMINDDLVLYRSASGGDTADYVMSLSGGKPQKVADVSPESR